MRSLAGIKRGNLEASVKGLFAKARVKHGIKEAVSAFLGAPRDSLAVAYVIDHVEERGLDLSNTGNDFLTLADGRLRGVVLNGPGQPAVPYDGEEYREAFRRCEERRRERRRERRAS